MIAPCSVNTHGSVEEDFNREVVTVCDHLVALGGRQSESKVVGKPVHVSLDRLVQRFRRDGVDLSQVGIEQHLKAANRQDARFHSAIGQ